MTMTFCSTFKTFSMHLSSIYIKSTEERRRTLAGLRAAPWQHGNWGRRARSHAVKCTMKILPNIELGELESLLPSMCMIFSASFSQLSCPGDIWAALPLPRAGQHLPWISLDLLWKQVSEGISYSLTSGRASCHVVRYPQAAGLGQATYEVLHSADSASKISQGCKAHPMKENWKVLVTE